MSNARIGKEGSAFSLLVPVSLAVLITLSLVALVLASQPKTGQAAVFYSPFVKADRALEFAAGAGALILRGGGWRNVVIIRDPDADERRRLHDSGAWLVIDAGSALGCMVNATSS